MDSFQHKGIWWLPENRDYIFSGTLAFYPSRGGRLELTELLTEEDVPKISMRKRFDMIYGVVEGGAPVTLKGCCPKRIHSVLPSTLHVSEIVVSSIHVNHQFADADEIIQEESSLSYSQISLGYTSLQEWMGQDLLEVEDGTVSRHYFKSIETELRDGENKFIFYFKYPSQRDSNSCTLRYDARIILRPNSKFHFDDYFWSIYLHLPNFLTLATG